MKVIRALSLLSASVFASGLMIQPLHASSGQNCVMASENEVACHSGKVQSSSSLRRTALEGRTATRSAPVRIARPAGPPSGSDAARPPARSADVQSRRSTVSDAASARSIFRSAYSVGNGGTIQVGGAATDADGNLYLSGGYWGTVTFATSPAVSFTSTGDADFYVAKLSPQGQPLWVRVGTGASNLPEGRALEGSLTLDVDANGNVYVGGGFVSELAFRDASGAVTNLLTGSNGSVNFEAFVAKYTTAGELVWARGGNSGAEAAANLGAGINAITQLVLDGNGAPHVAGRLSGVRFLGSETGIEPVDASVIAKLNPASGEFEWGSVTGGTGGDGVYSMALDANGNSYLVGYVDGYTEFFAEAGAVTVELPEDVAWATYIAKFDSSGDAQWAHVIGDPDDTIFANDVKVGLGGDIYVAGDYLGAADFGASALPDSGDSVHGFVARLDSEGEPVWARGFGGSDTSAGRIAIARSGHVWVAGWFSQNAIFSGGHAAPQTLTSESAADTFIAAFDPSGNLRNVQGQNGAGTSGINLIGSEDLPIGTIPIRLVNDRASGDLLFASDFNGSLSFAPGLAITASMEERNLFVARISTSTRVRGVRR